jgi:plasmid stabilization system protein ParE
MTYNIVLQEEAVLEIQEAFEWYENQKSGLGYELLAIIEVCFKKISQHPSHYTYINERYRRIKTNRFPYLIVYEIEELNVFIIGVRHAKRKPIE